MDKKTYDGLPDVSEDLVGLGGHEITAKILGCEFSLGGDVYTGKILVSPVATAALLGMDFISLGTLVMMEGRLSFSLNQYPPE